MENGIKNAINFLLYSYFGITLDSDTDSIKRQAIEKAYLDATMRRAFNALIKDGDIQKAKNDGVQIINDGIYQFIKTPGNYDIIHKNICKDLVKAYNPVTTKDYNGNNIAAFSYGNAQKWVNMTMKNLYVICNAFLASGKENDMVKAINSISNEMHIPIDSYILEAVWNDEEFIHSNSKDKLPIVEERMLKDGSYGAYSSEKIKPWSQWNEIEYYTFMQEVKKVKADPIDWECNSWIDVNRNRNK